MKKLLFVTLLLCFAQMMQADTVDENVNITIGGETRNYQLYVPDNVQANCPLVLSLHGANGHSTDKSPFSTGVADTEGCIVAYPQGKVTAFPIGFGGSTTGWTATGDNNFDVEFLKAVIEDVASKYTIDRKRIYCCGFSNGGMMTYAMSNACSDIIAACAAISGYPINEFHLRHTGSRPVPFLHIHGKEDGFVLYSKVPTIVDEMVARLGANPVPEKTTVSGKYTKSVYRAGDGSFPYIFYEIDGMGHEAYTANTEDGNSALTMWNFFKDYTLDSSCDPTLKWRPRIETAGFTPTSHGWTMNSGTTLLEFGGDQNTADNKNVYHSLQFNSGKYKLCFNSTGAAGKTITVKIQKLTSPNTAVLNTSVNVGENVELPFEVTDGWGEYKLTIIRPTASDAINVTDIAVYQTGEAEEEYGLIEIPQENVETSFTKADIVEGTDFTTYTTKSGQDGQLNIAIKTLNIDVENCDYVVIKFAEAVPNGWFVAFWEDQTTEPVPVGATEYKLFFSEDTHKDIGVKNGVLPQITLMTMWDYGPKTAKVQGIYKHRVRPASVSINSLVKIPQENVETGFPAATAVVGSDYTTYTATGNLQFAIKTINVDVTGCDYVVMTFAEPVPSGWCVAFWEDQTNEMIPTGSTEYKLVFSEDTHKEKGVKNGVLPQVTLMTRPWGEDVGTTSIKVSGVYKHIASDYSRTFSFDNALDFTDVEGLKAYVITAFNPTTATLSLSKVNQVPANTGLYLVGKGGDYNVPALVSADPIATNLLHASSGTDELNQTVGFYTNLIFGGTGDNRGFHPLSGAGIIGANKAYLQLPTEEFERLTSGARLSLVFEDETTVINTVNETMVADGAWYTLSGMKFNAKPTKKGIYINNGKKYAIQ